MSWVSRSVVSLVVFAFLSSAHAAERARPRTLDPAAVPVSLDREVESARLLAIERLSALLANTDLAPEARAELSFRYAELAVEQGRAEYLEHVAAASRRADACFAAPGCDPATLPNVDDTPRVWEARALKAYQRALAEAPGWARGDEATLALGDVLQTLRQPDEANTVFSGLVKAWPGSPLAADAYMRIGEYQFDRENLYKAINAYQHAAVGARAELAAYARYKLAWCLYDLGEPVDALAQLTELLRGGEAGSVLREEALRDWVVFYADLGDVDPDLQLARYTSAAERAPLRRALADRWEQDGKDTQVVQLARHVVAEAPDAPEAGGWALRIVRVYARRGDNTRRVAELEAFDHAYGPKSGWALDGAGSAEVAAVAEAQELELRRAATDLHVGAQKLAAGPRAAQQALAARMYALYLERYATAAAATELRYAYAELLYATHDYAAAYTQYTAVVDADPEGPRARFCAESAIFAATELAKAEAPREAAGFSPTPLGEWELREIAAIDRYIRTYGGDEVRAMTWRAGWTYYQHDLFREAGERFAAVIALDPRAKEAEQAAHLVLDSLAIAGDWEALRDRALGFSTEQGLGSASFRAEARLIGANAAFKTIEADFARDADKAAAADAWRGWAERYADLPDADLALHNAGVYYADLGRTRDAVGAGEQLVARHPRSRFVPAALAGVGEGYEALAAFEPAAAAYERYAGLPGAERATDALVRAATFREALGQTDAAVADWRRVAGGTDAAEARTATLAEARLLGAAGKTSEAAALYRRFYEAGAGTVDELAHARVAFGLLLPPARRAAHWQGSLAWLRNARAAEAGTPGPDPYAAHMAFEQAEPTFAAFMALRIDGPGERVVGRREADAIVSAQLVAKARAFQAVEAAYRVVIDTSDAEYGLAALVRLGAANENFAATLNTSWTPDYLTADQRLVYVERRGDSEYVQNERAVALYRLALDKGRELERLDPSTRLAAERLAVLEPDRGWTRAEQSVEPRFVASGGFPSGADIP